MHEELRSFMYNKKIIRIQYTFLLIKAFVLF